MRQLTFLIANNASSNLAVGIDTLATTIELTPGTGGRFPQPVVGLEYFSLTLSASGVATTEIVRVVERVVDTLTVERAPVPQAWPVGATVENRVVAEDVSTTARKGIQPSMEAGWNQNLQDYLKANWENGLPSLMEVGEGVLDTVTVPLIPNPNPELPPIQLGSLIGIGDENIGAGKKIILDGKVLSKLTVGTANPQDPEVAVRWTGKQDNPIYVWQQGWTIDAGIRTSNTALINIRNGVVSLRDMQHIGNPRLSLDGTTNTDIGAQLTMQGFVTGTVRDYMVVNSGRGSFNTGSLKDPGQTVTRGDRATNLSFIGVRGVNYLSNSDNKHSGFFVNWIGCQYPHDGATYGILHQNAAIRGGNGAEFYQIGLNSSTESFRAEQLADHYYSLVALNLHYNTGGPGAVQPWKDYDCQGTSFVDGVVVDCARMGSWPLPTATGDDPDANVSTLVPYLFSTGGWLQYVRPARLSSDFGRIGHGTITFSEGATQAVIIDNYFTGNSYWAATRCRAGDIIRRIAPFGVNTDMVMPIGRISTVDQPGQPVGSGGIGPREFWSLPNAQGVLLATVPWEESPPTDVGIASGQSVRQVITFDGPVIGAAATNEQWRWRRLLEMFYPVMDYTLGVMTDKWVPVGDPWYFCPLPNGCSVTVSTGNPTVTATNGLFLQRIKPILDKGIPSLFFITLPSGRRQTVGVIQTVTDNNTLVLTTNAFVSAAGVVGEFSNEYKMDFGGYFGGPNPEERARLRMCWVDFEAFQRTVGWAVAPVHADPWCLDPACIPTTKQITVFGGSTITTPVKVDYIPPPMPRGSQRLWRIPVAFQQAVVANLTDFVKMKVEKQRGSTLTVMGASSTNKHYTAASNSNNIIVYGVGQFRNFTLEIQGPTFSPTTTLWLQRTAWPGNVNNPWIDVQSFNATQGPTVINDGLDNIIDGMFYRTIIKTGDFTPGDDLRAILTFAGMDFGLTNEAHAAGSTAYYYGPPTTSPTSDSVGETNALRPEQGDKLFVTFYGVGAGGVLPDIVLPVGAQMTGFGVVF